MKKVDKKNVREFRNWIVNKFGDLPERTLGMKKSQELVDTLFLDEADVIYFGIGKVVGSNIPTNNQLLVSSIGGLFLEVQGEYESFIYYISSPLSLIQCALENGYMLIAGLNYFIDIGWNPEFFKN